MNQSKFKKKNHFVSAARRIRALGKTQHLRRALSRKILFLVMRGLNQNASAHLKQRKNISFKKNIVAQGQGVIIGHHAWHVLPRAFVFINMLD